MSPRLALIMACRNPLRRYLREAILSVINQINPEWELIIVFDQDDADSCDVLEALKIQDRRIRRVINQTLGLCGALNSACRMAEADFCAIIHSDDRLAVQSTDALISHIDQYNEIDFFHSGRRYIDDDSRFISSEYFPRRFTAPTEFRFGSPVKHLMCWRRLKAIGAGGFDEALGPHGADDYDFPWTMAEAGLQFMGVNECLYHYRDHRSHSRLTTHVPLDVQTGELSKIFKKHGLTTAEISEAVKSRSESYLRQSDPSAHWNERYM